MSTYYVRKTGSDANAGTSPAAAWLTIGKAMGAAGIANTGITNTVYVGAGVYREAVTVAMTSATAEQQIIADVDGTQTGDAGEVRWTAYLTSDTAAPGGAAPLNLNGRDYLTFKKFTFQAGTGRAVNATTTTSTNITFEDCTTIPGSATAAMIDITTTANVALNWVIDRCRIFGAYGAGNGVVINAPTSGTADYDVNVLIRNCLIDVLNAAVFLQPSGALANKPSGVDLVNCTLRGAYGLLTNTNSGTTPASTVTNCLMLGTNGTFAAASGQITENYNLIHAQTPRTNVTAGANSTSDGSKALRVHLGQEHVYSTSGVMYPFLSPTASSPLLGAGTNSGAPSVDLLGQARPNPPSIGCYELYTPPASGGMIGGGNLAGGLL